MLKASLAAAMLLACASPALADAVTYRGTIGKIPVVVELSAQVEAADGEIFGRYFYPRKGIDIPLDAVTHTAGKVTVREEKPCSDGACPTDDDNVITEVPLGATWVLSTTDDGETLTGTWSEGDKPLPVTLQRVAARIVSVVDETLPGPQKLADAALSSRWNGIPITPGNTPYDALKFSLVTLDESAVTDWDGNQFRYVTDPRTKFAFPRLVALADSGDIEPANTYLQNRHWSMNADALDCSARVYAGMGWDAFIADSVGGLGDYDYETIEVQYLSPTVLSWTEGGSLWCGGAHPDNHYDYYNLDVATGAPLDLSLIFTAWVPREFGGGPEIDVETARANPDGYEWGPSYELAEYIKAHRTKSDDATFEEECAIDDLISGNLKISFRPGDRVVFGLGSLPSVIAACGGDLYEAPIGDLLEFLDSRAAGFFPSLGG